MIKLIAQHFDREETGYQFPFVYLHGKLESINGYDIVTKETDDDIPFGIHDVIVDVAGKEYQAVMFYWNRNENVEYKKQVEQVKFEVGELERRCNIGIGQFEQPEWSHQLGLVVLKDDIKGYSDAKTKYENRAVNC